MQSRSISKVLATGLFVFALPAQADTIPVNSLLDGDLASLAGNFLCELREAVEAANTDSIVDRCPAGNGPDTIDMTGLSGVIALRADANELPVTTSIVFDGPGPATLTITGGGETRLFNIVATSPATVDVVFNGLTLQDGSNLTAPPGQGGGAILAREDIDGIASLEINNSVLTGHALFGQGNGGAINSHIHTTINDSVVDSNQAGAQAGGIQVANAALVINRSTISNNTANGFETAPSYGGGIFVIGGSFLASLTINDSTISGNNALVGLGGGVAAQGVTSTITNTTFSGNFGATAGAMSNTSFTLDRPSPMVINNSTIVDNTTPGTLVGLVSGILAYADDPTFTASVALNHTIMSNDPASLDCFGFGPLAGFDASGGYNVDDPADGDTACIDGGGPGNQSVDPLLGPLADNGGSTLTHHPLPGSTVIDAGDPAFSPPPANDQRGSLYSRVVGSAVDIGALELQPLVSIALTGSPFPENGGSAILTATLEGGTGQEVTVNLAYSGDAVHGVDFSAPTSIVIPVEQSSAQITLTGIDDPDIEPDESIVIDIDSVVNAFEDGVQQQTGVITSEDEPAVSLGLTGSPFAENGGSATLTATLNAVHYLDVTVNLMYAGTAAQGVDFSGAASIVVLAGQTSGSITLTGIDDPFVEPDEDFTVDIDSVVNGTEDGTQQVTGTVTSEDLPLVSLSAAPGQILEGDSASITATLSELMFLDVTVNLGYSGSAENPADFSAGPAIIIPSGSLSASIGLVSFDDALVEVPELAVIEILSASNAIEDGDQQASVEIIDNDFLPIPTVNNWGLVLLGLMILLAAAPARLRR